MTFDGACLPAFLAGHVAQAIMILTTCVRVSDCDIVSPGTTFKMRCRLPSHQQAQKFRVARDAVAVCGSLLLPNSDMHDFSSKKTLKLNWFNSFGDTH